MAYIQSGTGAKVNEDQIKSGTFSPDTYFVEEGTNRRVTQNDLTQYSNVPAGTDATGKQLYTSGVGPIPTPTPAPTTVSAPTLPQPTAPAVQNEYFTSAATNLENNRTAVEAAYKAKADALSADIATSEKRIADFEAAQKDVVQTDVQPLLQPFRADLETKQRDLLHVNENFEANQSLVRELDSLLTEGNDILKQQKEFSGMSSVRNPRVAKTLEDINARAGVIQAVMSARSGQIAEAERLIDRSVTAITADRKDQLDYYKTLYNFYENAKDDEGKKLVTLNSDQKTYLNARISLLESDLKNAQTFADGIKKAMTDPDTALLYAQAGVKLTDSPEQIATKVAAATYQKEVRDQSNKMAADGYTYLPAGQTAPAGAQIVTTTDTKGVKKSYYKAKTSTGSGDSLSILDVQRYQDAYPDAGVTAGDTKATADAKVVASQSPEAQTRKLVQAAKDNGNDYNTVITEINNDTSIKDKQTATKIADEIYGRTSAPPSKIETDIAAIKKGGILTDADARSILKSRGYSQAEINASSVGSVLDKIGAFLFGS